MRRTINQVVSPRLLDEGFNISPLFPIYLMIDYTKQSDALYQEIKRQELMIEATRQAAERLLVATSHYAPRKHHNLAHYG